MIERVRTKLGILPIDIAKALDENERDRRRLRAEADRYELEARCREAGYDPRTLPKMDPKAALKIYFDHMRAKIGSEELARRYPCRTCKVLHDEKYRALCLAKRVPACFMAARFAGCPSWQPRPVAVAATPGANRKETS